MIQDQETVPMADFDTLFDLWDNCPALPAKADPHPTSKEM